MRKNFCLYPFNAFSIDNSGKQRICCHNDAWDKVSLNTPISSESFDIVDSFNSELHKELRRYMLEDIRHDSCKKCWEVEDRGYESYRMLYNRSFLLHGNDQDYWISKCNTDGSMNHIEYMYLDITFGNKCNLKCIMCNGFNSTLFAKEQIENGMIDQAYYNKLMSFDWYKDGEIIKKIFDELGSVQRIHILGGEPLIIDHTEFLMKFVDLGIAKNIQLSYNTNLTTAPTEILDCWKHFKKVYLCASVDGYKEVNEFIRFPMKWEKLEKNIAKLEEVMMLHNNISVQVHSTFGLYNMATITDLLQWVKNTSEKYKFLEPIPMTNYVFTPKFFDPKNAPHAVKIQANNTYRKWLEDNESFVKRSETGVSRIGMLTSYFDKILDDKPDNNVFIMGLNKLRQFEKIRGISYPGFKHLEEDT